MHNRSLILSTLVALITCSAMAAEPIIVRQKGLTFAPNELTLAKGQDVEFINDDSTAHNIIITGDGVSFNGGLQPTGASVKYTFSKTGSFVVGCGIHPKMKLTVTVH